MSELSDDLFNDTPEGETNRPSMKWAEGRVNTRQIRSTRSYKKLHALFKSKCATQRNRDGSIGAICDICREPIDYWRKYPDPWSFSVQHIIPVAKMPVERREEMVLDTALWRASHLRCNSVLGVDEAPAELGKITDW